MFVRLIPSTYLFRAGPLHFISFHLEETFHMRSSVRALRSSLPFCSIPNCSRYHPSLFATNVSKRHTSYSVKDGRPFRMAVLGSGPAGFYTAYKVMSTIENAIIDIYEYLPVPFGLVRFGVAPDHPEVKVS